jgi:glycosyltransferase involved in cell wall biosynthesis
VLKEKVGISVLLVSYNHEKYIRQALDALFGQNFDGPIELVVADDKSTDSTLSIIKQYEGVDSRFTFKYLDYSKNLGITKNYKRGFKACSSEYVAVLEGDDYWVNPMKIQRQCDFLDNHWECDLCSVNYFVYEEDRAQFTARTSIGTGYRFLSTRDLIADNLVGNFSTCMYRKSALDKLPSALYEIKSYDWIVNICVAREGLIGFLQEPMSVYRLHAKGAWTKASSVEKLREQLGFIPAYDALTGQIFHGDFEILAKRLQLLIASSQIEGSVAATIKPFSRVLPGMLDYMPPVLLVLVSALVPPKLKRFFVRVLSGSRA